jgi:peptidoglycan hydrolase CwlO-like protein
MNTLQRLQEKIEELKNNYVAMQKEISLLNTQLEDAQVKQNDQLKVIELLKRELEEKDKEIEEIVTKVEELLS